MRSRLRVPQANGTGEFKNLGGDRTMKTGLPALAVLFGMTYVHGADSDAPQMLQIFHAIIEAGARMIDAEVEGGVQALF